MKRITFGLIALFLVLAVGFAIAGSGRESTMLPPQEVEIKYATESYAYGLKDINGVVRFKVLPDGSLAVINASGTTTWGISSPYGKSLYGQTVTVTSATYTSGVGYVMDGTEGDVILIDASPLGVVNSCSSGVSGVGPQDGAGVTVQLATVTAALDGKVWTFVNTTGTTDMFLYAPGMTISGGTPVSQSAPHQTSGNFPGGISSCTDFLTADGVGDTLTVVAKYNSAVSYYIINHYIH